MSRGSPTLIMVPIAMAESARFADVLIFKKKKTWKRERARESRGEYRLVGRTRRLGAPSDIGRRYKIGDSRKLNFGIQTLKPPPINSNGFAPIPCILVN
nr:hypothetical protein Iba_chr06eCG5470 [Ipomoea batatas]